MKMLILAVLGAIVLFGLIIVLTAVGSYNGLVGKSQAADSAWADVQNQYQRRADLVPNLVQTVQGAANFEKSTLVEVTDARASVGKVTINTNGVPADQATLDQYQAAQGRLGSALSHLLVVSEKYPDLKANRNFIDLQAQLEGTENRIATSRGDFNTAVQDYDTSLQKFPTVLIAGMFHFTSKPYFQAAPTAATAPTVNFNFNNQ